MIVSSLGNAHGQKYFRASKKTQVAAAYTLVYGGARKSCFYGCETSVCIGGNPIYRARPRHPKQTAAASRQNQSETAFVGELRILN
jgi:hypothetical protein